MERSFENTAAHLLQQITRLVRGKLCSLRPCRLRPSAAQSHAIAFDPEILSISAASCAAQMSARPWQSLSHRRDRDRRIPSSTSIPRSQCDQRPSVSLRTHWTSTKSCSCDPAMVLVDYNRNTSAPPFINDLFAAHPGAHKRGFPSMRGDRAGSERQKTSTTKSKPPPP